MVTHYKKKDKKPRKRFREILPEISIHRMIPNIITICAMSFGLSSIYFALHNHIIEAITVLLIAMALDGVDGKVARAINATSEIGGELDSLSDMVNFGVCPALITYIISMQSWSRIGWGICLFYTVCCCFRLARFNVIAKIGKDHIAPNNFFLGVLLLLGRLLPFCQLSVLWLWNTLIKFILFFSLYL